MTPPTPEQLAKLLRVRDRATLAVARRSASTSQHNHWHGQPRKLPGLWTIVDFGCLAHDLLPGLVEEVQRLQRWETTNEGMTPAMEQLLAERDKLGNENEKLKDELNSSNYWRQRWSEDCHAAAKRVQEMVKARRKEAAELAKVQAENAALIKQLEVEQTVCGRMRDERDEAVETLKTVREEMDKLLTEITKLRKAERDALCTERDEAIEALKTVREEMDQARADLEILRKLTNAYTELCAERDQLRAENEKLCSGFTRKDFETEISALRAERDRIKAENDALKTELTKSEAKRNALHGWLRSAVCNYETANAAHEAAELRIVELRTINERVKALPALWNQVVELTKKYERTDENRYLEGYDSAILSCVHELEHALQCEEP